MQNLDNLSPVLYHGHCQAPVAALPSLCPRRNHIPSFSSSRCWLHGVGQDSSKTYFACPQKIYPWSLLCTYPFLCGVCMPSLGLVLCCLCLSPRRILEQCCVDRAGREVYVADDRSANKHVFGRALQRLSTNDAPVCQVCELTRCGHRISSTASALSSLIFKYWSTLFSVPRIWTSFFSSTVISCSTSVLKKLSTC